MGPWEPEVRKYFFPAPEPHLVIGSLSVFLAVMKGKRTFWKEIYFKKKVKVTRSTPPEAIDQVMEKVRLDILEEFLDFLRRWEIPEPLKKELEHIPPWGEEIFLIGITPGTRKTLPDVPTQIYVLGGSLPCSISGGAKE